MLTPFMQALQKWLAPKVYPTFQLGACNIHVLTKNIFIKSINQYITL